MTGAIVSAAANSLAGIRLAPQLGLQDEVAAVPTERREASGVTGFADTA
jgi:hypothetical protein